jgi:DAACS family dicarboxylate/amino acid:cation (Na+ or H+) symporter
VIFYIISFIDKLIPSNFIEPFTSNNVLTLVLMAVLIAAAIRSLPSSYSEVVKAATKCAHGGFVISERLITMLVALTPIAVFCVIAKVVGLTGFQHVVGLLNYLGVCLGALLLQIVIVYQFWIVMVVGMPLRLFWKASLAPALYAFSINSSLAALPETLRALSHLGASKESARLAACIGTNLNNDGILLYETLAIIIIAQALGIELTFAEQLSTALLCVIVSLGMSGIPEAGIIGLTLILTTLKLPAEMLPLLLTVDWIIARMRSATNVIADITTGLVLNSYQNRRTPTIGT